MPRPATLMSRLNALLNTPGFGFHTPAPQDAAGSPQDGPTYSRFPPRVTRDKGTPVPIPEADGAIPFQSRRAPRVQPRRVTLPEDHVKTDRPVLREPGPEPGPAISTEEDMLRFVEDLPRGLMTLDVSDVEAALRKHARVPDDWAVSSDFRRGYELATKKIALGIYNRLVDKRQEGA